jgi:hypothetical protein
MACRILGLDIVDQPSLLFDSQEFERETFGSSDHL